MEHWMITVWVRGLVFGNRTDTCGCGGVFLEYRTDTVGVWGCVFGTPDGHLTPDRHCVGVGVCFWNTGQTPDGHPTPDGHRTDTVWVWGCARTDTGPTLCGCGGVFYVRLGSVCCVICLPSVCPVSFISPSCVRLHFRNFGYGRTDVRTDGRTDVRTYGRTRKKKAMLIYPLASLKRSLGI